MKLKVLLICNTDGALYVFRRPIIDRLIEDNYSVETTSSKGQYFEKLKKLGVLAHELNFSNDPLQLLREIDRVLTLDGTLILTGYNPLSLFGLRSLLKSKHRKTARLFFPSRVLDWLYLLGFEVKKQQYFNFLSCESDSFCASSIESFGQCYAPYLCSVYFIIAKKQSATMTPIKSPFKFKKPMIGRQTIATRQ